MKVITDMMEDYDLLVADADAETIREWVEQALNIMRSETVEAVVGIIHEELRKAPLEAQMTKGVIFADVIKRLRTELLGKEKDV